MSILLQMNEDQVDLLKEVGNIGAGHSATALATLLDRRIEMEVPYVKLLSFDELANFFGRADVTVVSIFLRMEGDFPGSLFVILPLDHAENIIKEVIGDAAFSMNILSSHELGKSALHEIGNILAGSYLSSIADLANLSLYPSVPELTIDMFGAIIGEGLLELSQLGEQAMVIDTSIFDHKERRDMKAHLFLLPAAESFEKLFAKLGAAR